MSFTDLFDCTFIINLPHRADRRRAITRELTKARVELTPGVVEIFHAVRPTEAAGFPSAGVRGCYLSHLGVLKEGQRRGYKTVLILEDDLVLSPAVEQHGDDLTRAMEQPWDIVYFGHIEPVESSGPPRLVPYAEPVRTSHFYAIRQPALSRLIDYLDEAQLRPPGHPAGGPMHLDGALTMFRQANSDVLTRIAVPNLGWQRPSRSDIHSNWFQQAPVFRYAYELGRFVRSLCSRPPAN